LPKIALYLSTIAFASVAVIFGLLAVFEVDVLVGKTFYRPISLIALAVFSAVLAVWMIIASLDLRRDQ
jgi:hypothetical protein